MFKSRIPPWIQLKPKVQAHWNVELQTLKLHTDWVTSVAFSPDGKQVVSGSVRLWDVATGAALQTLKGHTDFVTSVIFSPAASRSCLDLTIRQGGSGML
jgi:WD40 repeat protein